jgi:DNA-binding GntR family transcriptional regulator
LTSIAYGRLKEAIVSCELRPGTWLTERAVAADLDLGVMPVKQALARLSAEGLVITRPRHGYVVTPLSERTVDELFEVWAQVCGALVELATTKASAQQIERIADAVRRSAGRPASSAAEFAASGDAIWTVVTEAADNDRLTGIFEQTMTEVRRLFALSFAGTDRPELRQPSAAIADLLVARDSAGARVEMIAFIEAHHQAARQLLADDPSLPLSPDSPWARKGRGHSSSVR